MNEEVRALNDALENLNTRKSKSKRILTGISSKNSETCKLTQNLSSEFFKAWCSRYYKKKLKHYFERNLSPVASNGNQMVNS